MASNEDALTTEEVANLLKVSKLTVYDLIKKGVLPSYRVGRQIRVERTALDSYKQQGQQTNPVHKSESDPKQMGASPIIITGQDHCLDLLAKQLENKNNAFQPLRSHIGSLNGLIDMYHGKADIVSTHLYDGDSGTYNLPYVRKILISQPFLLIHLLKREAGFFVAKGNPKNIGSWDHLFDPNITIVNREQGAGARVFLNEQLRLHGINPTKIQGYDHILSSHTDIANAIANREADVGIGTRYAANIVDIDFVPLIEESYDLVILNTKENSRLIQNVRAILEDNTFQNMLKNMGYNVKETGKVLYEQS